MDPFVNLIGSFLAYSTPFVKFRQNLCRYLADEKNANFNVGELILLESVPKLNHVFVSVLHIVTENLDGID